MVKPEVKESSDAGRSSRAMDDIKDEELVKYA